MTANLKRFDPAGPDEGAVIVSGTVLYNVILNSAGTATYEADAGAVRGSNVGVEVNCAAAADQAILYLQTASAASGSAQAYLYLPQWPAVQTEIFGLRNSGNALRVGVTPDGHLAAQGKGGTNLASTIGPLTLSTWYRIDLQCTPDASGTAGSGSVTIHNNDDTVVDSWTTSAGDFGTDAISQARVGKLGSASALASMWLTQFALDTAATPPTIDPVPVNAAPPTVTGSFPYVWSGTAWI